MCADHRAGALAVDVEIADVEFMDGSVDLVAGTGVDGASESELGVVGDLKRVVETAGLDHGEHGSKDFFLLKLRLGLNIGNHGGLNKVALAGSAFAAGNEAS